MEERESKFNLLENNGNAVSAVMSAVESTIGPKGLDTMLVDQFGEVVITNDGITILNMMEVNHPVAKMLIHAIGAQQEEVGDGTTTATLVAGEMVLQGLKEINRGVPIAKVIEGIRVGIKHASQLIVEQSTSLEGLDQAQLFHIALVAGREYEDIARLIVEAVLMLGQEKLSEEQFKLSHCIKAIEGAHNEVFAGVLINKERLDKQMPISLDGGVKILVIDDALEPEEFDDEALATESGFQRYLQIKEEFRVNLQKIIDSGAKAVFVDRGVADLAEEMLSEAGILVVARVPNKELQALAEHCGCRMIKRTGLKKSVDIIANQLGFAQSIQGNEKLKHVKVIDGAGKAMATVIVSASTAEIVGERERIAKDAASSVQVTLRNGLVVGGGVLELVVARELEQMKHEFAGMVGFGVDCVIAALRKPFMQIVLNAGFNPLEKIGDVYEAQSKRELYHLGINCDTGEVVSLLDQGIVDPTYAKLYGLKVAGEVAEAILRINMIVKKKEYQENL